MHRGMDSHRLEGQLHSRRGERFGKRADTVQTRLEMALVM
jgi:hypothetical protein